MSGGVRKEDMTTMMNMRKCVKQLAVSDNFAMISNVCDNILDIEDGILDFEDPDKR